MTLEKLSAQLTSFDLKQVAPKIADILEEADRYEYSHRQLLETVLNEEIEGRNKKKRNRNYASAHFPPYPKPLDAFDPAELMGGITASPISQLRDLDWIDRKCNVLFFGPPETGKTHLAVGIALEAVEAGYSVAVKTMENLVWLFENASAVRNAGFRLRKLQKVQLIVIDEIGYIPVTREQANRFFSFINGAYERTSIVFTTNKDITQWAEIFGDPVITQAMLDRILHHAKCFSLDGDSYRLKHPELYTPLADESSPTARQDNF